MKYKLNQYFTVNDIKAMLKSVSPKLKGVTENTFLEVTVVSWVAMQLIIEYITSQNSESDDVIFDETIFHEDALYSAVKHRKYNNIGGFEFYSENQIILDFLESNRCISKFNNE